MTKYEKLQNIKASSILGFCAGYQNFETDFASESQDLMKEDILKYNAPFASLVNFNNGYDGPGIKPWTLPDPDENHITVARAQNLIGHQLETSDDAVRFSPGLIAKDGLIRPVVFALSGQKPPKSRSLSDEEVLGIFSPINAKYDSIDDAVQTAKCLRQLCKGEQATIDGEKFFTQDILPEYLQASYDELEATFIKNGNLLAATILQSGIPLGQALRKLGKIEAYNHLLSDAAIVLAGSSYSSENTAHSAYRGYFLKHMTMPGIDDIISFDENLRPRTTFDSKNAELSDFSRHLDAYRQITQYEGFFSTSAILAEEKLRKNATPLQPLQDEEATALLPPKSPLKMILSPNVRILILADQFAEKKREKLKNTYTHANSSQSGNGILKKMKMFFLRQA